MGLPGSALQPAASRHDTAWAITTSLHLHLQFFAELVCPGREGYADAPHSAFSFVALIGFNRLRVDPTAHARRGII